MVKLSGIVSLALVAALMLPLRSDAQLTGFGRPPEGCIAPQGEIVPGVPRAVLCGRSGLLDDPIDPYLNLPVRTRAGFVHAQLVTQLLRAGRAFLGPVESAQLAALPTLDPPFFPPRNHSIARALLADIARTGDPALQAQLDAFSVSLTGVPFAGTLNSRLDRLLAARQDRNRVADVSMPGFPTTPTADTVNELSLGLSSSFFGGDRVMGSTPPELGAFAIPTFIGPDGVVLTPDDLPVVACPDPVTGAPTTPGPDGRCTTGATDAENEPLYYVLPSGGGTQQACDALMPVNSANGPAGGFNANGECVVLSVYGIVIGGFPNTGGNSGTLAALDKLVDTRFRPAAAVIEPTDLVDLRVRAFGSRLPARPLAPAGGLVFDPTGAGSARRVDPETGAPVRANGPLECDFRPGGPDGDLATTVDNDVASTGNCLLFDDPSNSGPQSLRADNDIATDHSADQSLFHTLCTGSFDEDVGQCALDFTNGFRSFAMIASVLGGSSFLVGLALDGYPFVRPAPADPDDPFDKEHLTELGIVFGGAAQVYDNLFGGLPDANSPTFTNGAIFATTTPEQRALLGCGEAHLSACDQTQAGILGQSDDFLELVGIPPERGDLLRGGIDFQNADGSVMFQEFSLAKVATAGALVGQRSDPGARFEAGISGRDVIDPTEAVTIGVGAWQVARDRLAMNLFAVPYASLTNRAQQLQTATDFNVEPPKWVIDPDQLAAGIVAFQDPRGPNGVWNEGTGDDVVNPLGENCTGTFGVLPDPGCTSLEVLSANLERLFVANEILGRGQAFDPPETFAEMQAMLDGDPSNDATGDPVAGPDGIRWNNFDANGDGVVGDGIAETGDQKAAIGGSNLVVVATFRDCLLGTVTGGPIGVSGRECYLNLDNPATRPLPPPVNGISASRDSFGRLIGMLPIGLRLTYRNDDAGRTPIGASATASSAAFPFQRLTPREMQLLVQSGELEVPRDAVFTTQDVADLTSIIGAPIPATIVITPTLGSNLRIAFFDPLSGYDIDNNATRDVDEDHDNTFDLIDDGLSGPTFAGNITCGSGVPGDVLQIAAQHELDATQRALLAAAYPNGFPPRSPVFCGSSEFLLGTTGESSPGRRDFLWHGAAEDQDEDGVSDLLDVCPTIADPDQADLDSDGVGDLCDSCVEIKNARIASPPPAPFTTSGGQRDDDADGFGNVCDAKVTGGAMVSAGDTNEFVVSIGRRRTTSTCGGSRTRSCAIFDLDERSLIIGAPDVARLISLLGRRPGPRCSACGDFLQLPCEGPACPAPAP